METEDKKATIEGIYSKMVEATEVDHELEPLTWPSLKTKWQEKSIGTGYLDQESEKIGNLYQLLPEELRTNIREGAIGINQFLTDWNQDRRDTNVLGVGPVDAVTGVEWGIDKAADLLSTVTRVDKRYFDLTFGNISKGAVANRMLKRINTLKKYNASKGILKRLEAAQEAGDTFEMNKILKEIEILDADFIKKQEIGRNIKAKLDDPDGFKRFKWYELDSKIVNRVANTDNKVLSKVQSTIDMMDDWRFKNITSNRPMTGFIKEYGKPTFWFENKEWGIGWSRSANNKTGGYEIFDVQKRIERRAARLHGDKVSNPESASLRQIKEALRRDLNKQAKDLPVEQWDLMIQNPGDAYIEHLIAVKSPYWKSKRGKNAGYLAGDSKNLKVLTDQRFKSLKDRIESHVHANYKDLYVDYDPITQNLVLKNLDTGKALPTQIPGYGRPSDWYVYLEDALSNKPMKSIVDVSPETAPNVQRQIDSQLSLKDFSQVEINALLDYANGMSWKNIKNKYGKKINRQNLELFEGKSKTEVIQIINAYKLGGKGRTKF